ncbi:unnamed protein product [Cercospora beticola]|nr:unnamed protein product [Cercospora beticola]
MSLSTSDLYDNPAYSDITISFSGRSVHCHKLILCTKSEYFRMLCGSESAFSESSRKVIELKEDDPDAVEHVLRYLYSGNHHTDQDSNWKLQLQIANAAQKYLVTDLAKAATEKFTKGATATSRTEDVFETIMHIRQNTLLPNVIQQAQDLESTFLRDLLRLPAFRELVEKDRTLVWKYLDRLNDTLTKVEKSQVCRDCRRTVLASMT